MLPRPRVLRHFGGGDGLFWAILLCTTILHIALVFVGLCALAVTLRRLDALGLSSASASVIPTMLLAGLAVAGLSFTARTLLIEMHRMGRFRQEVSARAQPVPPALASAAARAGLGDRVDLVDSQSRFAATYGLRRPRVAVSSALLGAVTEQELGAVLAHESVHLRGRDPLRLVILKVLPARAYYLPVLRQLRSRFAAHRELAADRGAMDHYGRRPLVGALLKVVDSPSWAVGQVAQMGARDTLEVRLAQMERGVAPPMPRVSPGVLYQSVIGLVAIASGFGGSVPVAAACYAHCCVALL